MKLVTIILLLCVHSADPADCPGKKDLLVFCPNGAKLKLDTGSSVEVTWKFNVENALPSDMKHVDATNKKDLEIDTLTAAHTGVYKATYDPSIVDKFTIIVGAVTCGKGDCVVKTDGSIRMDSGATGDQQVTWKLKAAGSTAAPVPVPDPGESDPPKFTEKKHALGLFKVTQSNMGQYTASVGEIALKTFTVRFATPVTEAKVQKRQSGCNVILECNVKGDAQSFKWTKDDSDEADATQKQLTIQKVDAGANANYVCKATDYGNGEKTSAAFAYTYAAPQAVSDVLITRKGNVLTCEAKGVVQSFKWEMEDGTAVTSQHGAVDAVESKFKLNSKAKGSFVCVATGCDGKAGRSDPFSVDGKGSEEGGSSTNNDESDNGHGSQPGSGPQGASTSVALLLISVLVELYVMML